MSTNKCMLRFDTAQARPQAQRADDTRFTICHSAAGISAWPRVQSEGYLSAWTSLTLSENGQDLLRSSCINCRNCDESPPICPVLFTVVPRPWFCFTVLVSKVGREIMSRIQKHFSWTFIPCLGLKISDTHRFFSTDSCICNSRTRSAVVLDRFGS